MEKISSSVLVSFLAVASSTPARGFDHMFGWGHGMGWGGGAVMLFFWIAAVAAIAFFVRWVITSGEKKGGHASSETAMDVLNKRYARGEISREEYEKIKKDIS